MKFGVVVFPGSNCDDDMMHVLGSVLGYDVFKIWHKTTSVDDLDVNDCIVLPGGFSFGDYLRAGAIAQFSPIMDSIKNFAERGGKILGICNGFQILCEVGLLPGILLRNKHQRFISKSIFLKTMSYDTDLTRELPMGKALQMPIAHADGRYFINQQGIQGLYDQDQILFTYCDENGDQIDIDMLNGSTDGIAGICNSSRNVFGMMPHPERAAEKVLGSSDGRLLFESLVKKSVGSNLVL